MTFDPNDLAAELETQAHQLLTRAKSLRELARSMPVPSSPTGLLTVGQFCERNPWAKPGGLRHAIFHAEENGLKVAIVRFGRRVLLDEAKVLEWMRSDGGGLSRGGLKRRAS